MFNFASVTPEILQLQCCSFGKFSASGCCLRATHSHCGRMMCGPHWRIRAGSACPAMRSRASSPSAQGPPTLLHDVAGRLGSPDAVPDLSPRGQPATARQGPQRACVAPAGQPAVPGIATNAGTRTCASSHARALGRAHLVGGGEPQERRGLDRGVARMHGLPRRYGGSVVKHPPPFADHDEELTSRRCALPQSHAHGAWRPLASQASAGSDPTPWRQRRLRQLPLSVHGTRRNDRRGHDGQSPLSQLP